MRPNNPRRLGPRILRLASHRTSTVAWSARLVSAVVLLVFFFFFFFLFWDQSRGFCSRGSITSSVRRAPWRALSKNRSSFWLLNPGRHPAAIPFWHSAVVEQCVLTGRTAVSPSPPACVRACRCQPMNSTGGQKWLLTALLYLLKSTVCAVLLAGSQSRMPWRNVNGVLDWISLFGPLLQGSFFYFFFFLE